MSHADTPIDAPFEEHLGEAPGTVSADLRTHLRSMGLRLTEGPEAVRPLPGGVSSDIWLVQTDQGAICVKRALAQLKVAQTWRAPVGRNRYEYAWMQTVSEILPDAVPKLLGQDEAHGLFAMAYLDPAIFPVWKALLHAGRADPAPAAAVGSNLGRIHAATAGRPEIASRFDTDAIFHAIRLEPYLEATARAHPDLSNTLMALSTRTAETRLALVHGDASPKNILIGARGPVFLDAECAWYGDPAFDPAFCLNHLLLKCLWTPAASDGFLACFAALTDAYLDEVTWEPVAAAEARIATLLPGLLLARIDGKSPVEYIKREADKAMVRAVARQLLQHQPESLAALREIWRTALANHQTGDAP